MSLGRVLAAGAAFDLVFAAAILVAPRYAARVMHIELPPDLVYLRLSGVLLAILGGIYAAAAREPDRYAAVAPVAGAGRLAGFALLSWAWWTGHPTAFGLLGLADLVIGLATLRAWRRASALSA